MSHVEDPRRVPRLTATCRVEVRDRFTSWQAKTEDLGPRGCHLVMPRAANVGDVVMLTITSPLVDAPLNVLGLVCWTRPGAETRVGISFSGPTLSSLPADRWFERLVAADPAARLRDARRAVDAEDLVYLAPPPEAAPALTPTEVRILRAVGTGAPVSALRAAARSEQFEGTLFALLSRRLLTLARGAAAPPALWDGVLEQAEVALASREIADVARLARGAAGATLPLPRPPPPRAAPMPARPSPAVRNPEAQRLYERAVELLTSGNATAAEALVRSAVALAPGDPVLQSVLRRFTRR